MWASLIIPVMCQLRKSPRGGPGDSLFQQLAFLFMTGKASLQKRKHQQARKVHTGKNVLPVILNNKLMAGFVTNNIIIRQDKKEQES